MTRKTVIYFEICITTCNALHQTLVLVETNGKVNQGYHDLENKRILFDFARVSGIFIGRGFQKLVW